jgi:hypothetical protein
MAGKTVKQDFVMEAANEEPAENAIEVSWIDPLVAQAARVRSVPHPFVARADKDEIGRYCVWCGDEKLPGRYPTLHDANLAVLGFDQWRKQCKSEPEVG